MCQCLSSISINIADPRIGVITAKALNIKSIEIVMKGISIRLFLKPGIVKVRRVTSKLVNEIVVLIPAKYTPTTSISCIPAPVNCSLEEKGVINVHPETVCVAFEHLTKCLFLRLTELAFVVKNQKD